MLYPWRLWGHRAGRQPLQGATFLINGEAVVCRDDGLTDSEALRSRRRDHDVVLFAFELIEHQGDDLRNAAGPQAATPTSCSAGPSTPSTSMSIWRMTARPCSSMF